MRHALTLLMTTGLAACGPGLHDGSYAGEPRFIIDGSILGLMSPPAGAAGEALIALTWLIIPAPPPPRSDDDGRDASDESASPAPTVGSGPADSAQPPTEPAVPTVPAADGAVGGVHFPAPVSLSLYDTPVTSTGLRTSIGLGQPVIFYDLNATRAYEPDADAIAGSADTHALLYRGPGGATELPGAILDNPAALAEGFNLVTRTCVGGKLHLAIESPGTILFGAHPVPTCP
ncbi:MAG TPA: hypothetical protein VFH51_14420 [Myxococcota bacterium]|nr:hypothetical protein [Myxococcota bacterium]